MSKVAIIETTSQTIIEDYSKLLDLINYQSIIKKELKTIIKINLSWTLFYPACSTPVWQLDGVLNKLINDGLNPEEIIPTENQTVVTHPYKGAYGNKWFPIFKKYQTQYRPLTNEKWIKFNPKNEVPWMRELFKDNIIIPEIFMNNNIIHLPTLKCVHPDTEIFLSDGSLVNISNFINVHHKKEKVFSTQENDKYTETSTEIVSYKGKICKSNTYRLWKTPAPKTVYKILTKTGKEVIVSENHPFLTPKGWIKARNLQKKIRIAIPRNIGIEGKEQVLSNIPTVQDKMDEIFIDKINFKEGRKFTIEQQKEIIREYLLGRTTTEIAKKYSSHYESIRAILLRYNIPIRWVRPPLKLPRVTSEALWEWMGYFLSEGYASDTKGSMRYWFSNMNDILKSRFIKLTKSLFNIEIKIRDNNKDMYFDSNEFIKFMNSLGFEENIKSYNKRIPRILFKCSEKEIVAFLQGYFDGDGTVGKDGLHITTKSKRLAKDMVYLLLRIGIISFLDEVKNEAINAKNPRKRKYWRISIYGDDVVSFNEKVTLRVHKKKNRLNDFSIRRLKSKRPSNWDTIPVNRVIFRSVRKGLGFTQESTGKPSSVNSIENGHSQPTRHIMNYFIQLFESKSNGKFRDEIKYFKKISSTEIAWDHIKKVEKINCDSEYLFDLSVDGTNCFIGNGTILHNTHGHTVTTGAIKNAFGGLIPKYRHHSHRIIDGILVDLLAIQKEIHPGMLAVMDGTVAGDGAGPRVMEPVSTNLLLASEDQVAIDALSAKIMGFDPLSINYIRMAHDQGLGTGDVDQIEIIGLDSDKVRDMNYDFTVKRSLVVRWDQRLRNTTFRYRPLKPFHWLFFHTPIFKLLIAGSSIYHDWFWYRFIGKRRIKKFQQTEWGKLYDRYEYGEKEQYPKIKDWNPY
ncbi:MAG: LAGLIDADG family homing endonuclease [Promethearchaeota archaeon]